MDKIKNYLKTKKHLAVVLAAVIVGIGIGYGLRGHDSAEKQPAGHEEAMAATAEQADHEPATVEQAEVKEGMLYICPMNCVEPMAKPGRCPVCGMDLVAMDAHDHQQMELPGRITLSEEDKKIAGIQVAPVEQKFISAEIRLYGKIEYDPVEQYRVTAFVPGVVDNIYVKRAGQVVRKGDPLFDLHSSELFFLEQELFETIEKFPFMLNIQQSRGHGKERLGRWAKVILPGKSGKSAEVEIDEEQKKAAEESLGRIRNKMRLMGLSKKAIDRVMIRGKPSGIATITTPMTGVVLEQNAYRGAYVNTGDLVFTIANPRVLWVRLDAYASDFPWIRLGQEVEFETDAYPGMTLKGKIVFIDPEFNPETLVFKVGALYTDRKGLLKPNMLVRGVILASMKSGGESVTEVATRSMKGIPKMKRTNLAPLVIPDTAPLITGERAIVYVQVPDKPGNYVGREVKLGPRGKGYYIVKNGLHKGEMVVVNGNFKIDSAVQILAKSSMMTQKAGKLPVDHYRHVESPPIPTEAKAGQAAHKHVKSRKLKMRPTSRKEARKELEERLQRRRQSE